MEIELLLKEIEAAFSQESQDRILRAVLRGWRKEHPNDELVLISLPKENMQERKRILESVYRLERKECFKDENVFSEATEK